jgi:hypothetical protein
MCVQARLHADNAGRDLLESLSEGEPLDLLAQNVFPLASKTDQVKDILPDIDADRGKGGYCCFCFGVHLLLLFSKQS